MATKTPLKTAKPAAKKTTPAKKAVVPAKVAKSSAKTVAAKPAPATKAPAKPAKVAVMAKPQPKTSPVKKTSKAVAPAPVAKKAAPQPVKKALVAVKAGVKADKQPLKKAPEVKQAPVKAPPVVEAHRENGVQVKSGKQIIVPSKPAINPRPQKAEKQEPVKPSKPVAMPKMSTDKKVDYEPEFIKSVLDGPVQQQNNPTMRYSDTELQEFRELINKKLDAAKKELAYLQGLITRKDEMGGDESDNRYMTMEDGSMSMEREQLSQMASRQITFIDHLEKAIMRIENKTYGICRVTGKLIDKARLRAVPHATLSMEAKLGIVK
jgi:RNA polymerase-binding transcription factor DksA